MIEQDRITLSYFLPSQPHALPLSPFLFLFFSSLISPLPVSPQRTYSLFVLSFFFFSSLSVDSSPSPVPTPDSLSLFPSLPFSLSLRIYHAHQPVRDRHQERELMRTHAPRVRNASIMGEFLFSSISPCFSLGFQV